MEAMDTDQVYMVRSAKGYDMLCVDSYLYHYEDRGTNSYRWVCNKRKDKHLPCRSRITTSIVDGDESRHVVQKVVGDHTHGKCSANEIFKVYERKRLANLAGEACTLESKMLKRRMKRIEEYEGETKKPRNRRDTNASCEPDSDVEDQQDDDYWGDNNEGNVGEIAEPSRLSKDIRGVVDTEATHLLNFEQQKLYMLKTPLENRMMCLDGFLYRLEGKSQTRSTYRWECIKRREILCKARVVTECMANGEHKVKPTLKEEHAHEPYTPWKLSKVLKKHNISIIAEYEQETHDDAAKSELQEFIQVVESAGFKKDLNLSKNSRQAKNDAVPTSTNLKQQKTRTKESPCSFNDPLAPLMAGPKTRLDKTKFSFLPSAKGNKVLCLENFIYHFDSRSPRNGHSYWTCLLRRDKCFKCNARVTTELTDDGPVIVKISGTHMHPDSSDDIKRRMYKDVIAKNVNKTELKPSEILQHSINELGDDFKEIVAKSKESIERRIGRLRLKMKSGNAKTQSQIDEEANNSTSSFSSALDSDDDYLDDDANLPTKLEQMRQKVTNTDKINMKIAPKEEVIVGMANANAEEMEMEEEYLDTANFDVEAPYNNNEDDDEDMLADSEDDTQPVFKLGRKYKDSGIQEPDMDITKVSTLRSAKGGELLCVDGYIYHWKSGNNRVRTYWTCIKCKDRFLKCKSRIATIMTNNGIKIVRVTNLHTHPVNEADIKRRLFNEYKNRKSGQNIMPKDILQKSLNELSTKYAELVAHSKGAIDRHSLKFEPRTAVADNGEEESSIMKLYAVSDGPPSLAVRMTLKALNIPYELINVDYIASEHMSETYAKMNPQKEIPVLDDDGFYLSESIAIMQYLCDKYASNTDLYPKDATQRAIVNHRLCFNMGFYYSSISTHTMAPIFFDYQRNEMSLKKVNNALEVFQKYLERFGTKYAAADHLTIADFALVSATLCLEAIEFDLSPFPLVKKWYATFKQEQSELWEIANGGMQEIVEFEKNPPDLSHMNHPFHPTRKAKV